MSQKEFLRKTKEKKIELAISNYQNMNEGRASRDLTFISEREAHSAASVGGHELEIAAMEDDNEEEYPEDGDSPSAPNKISGEREKTRTFE